MEVDDLTRWLAVLMVLSSVGACRQEPSIPTDTVTPDTASQIGSNGSPAQPSTIRVPSDLTPARVTRVVDGDTIEVEIDGQTFKLRYIGIDTPETVDPRQPVQCFGREASERNQQLVGGRPVGLERDVSDTDDFGRLLRYVWLEGRMVNAAMVEEGYAMASTYPPDVKYAAMFAELQIQARQTGRGLWGAVCQTPARPPLTDGVCDYSTTAEPVIKGNISFRTGEKIYHVPDGEFYDETIIDASKGEVVFCAEAEAVAAGWRRSLR